LYDPTLREVREGWALDWLRSKGEGHLTRINDILNNLMEAERRLARGDSAIPGSPPRRTGA
jgi:hypothetical protein